MHYQSLYELIADSELQPWLELMPQQVAAGLDENRYGDLPRWRRALSALPEVEPGQCDFNAPAITTGMDRRLAEAGRMRATDALRGLMPWRKGPYRLHGVDIDTEWRSDWKWQRLAGHIESLSGRRVLDVGCGNGYHGWRMLGAGAELVIGIDPSPLFIMQYSAVKHFAGDHPLYVLPMGIDDVPARLQAFDSVFSMGVLYHRRSPVDHLLQLKDCLRPGGELVLETLVIDGDENQVLLPHGRYAKMRNVWFIPSHRAILLWLQRCGFVNLKLVDVCRTSIEEQRRSEWMQFESLADFLDPSDHSKTIEGYPAPTRAVFTAQAPL
jgi:tRNA (mo5U34)-methyltransferase